MIHRRQLYSITEGFKKFVKYDYPFCIIEARLTNEIGFSYPNEEKRTHREYNYYYEILESIYLKLYYRKQIHKIIIVKKSNKNLCNAILYYINSLGSGNKVTRYLTLYKSYESITNSNERNLIFVAIRHGLAHSTSHLTRQNVINTLINLFGTIDINTNLYKHRKLLHIKYWELLIETDKLLFEVIKKELKRSYKYLNDYKVIK